MTTAPYPGLLAVWNDIGAADESEFNASDEEEHFPERLSLPGILTARRYRDVSAPLRYAAIYDTASVAVLTSPAYLDRLANPSARDSPRDCSGCCWRRKHRRGGTPA